MIAIAFHFICVVCACFKSRRRLEAEILVLRHQLNVLQQRAHHADCICVGPTAPRSFGSIVAVRTQVLRPAHARSSGSETSLHIRSLAGSIIGTLESGFRKRQGSLVRPEWSLGCFDANPERRPKRPARIDELEA